MKVHTSMWTYPLGIRGNARAHTTTVDGIGEAGRLGFMGVLVIDDVFKQDIVRVRAFAELPSNWYRPEKHGPPGDNPRYVVKCGTYRIVFSITFLKDQTFRHLSISTSGTSWPNPLTIWTVAHLFGFTGVEPDENDLVHDPGDDWMVSMDEEYRAVVVAQRLP